MVAKEVDGSPPDGAQSVAETSAGEGNASTGPEKQRKDGGDEASDDDDLVE